MLLALDLMVGWGAASNIADHPLSRVDDFLPWNCAAQLPSA
ncbi:hypothetical protein ACQ4WY_22815 [Janthinobacterium sp. LB2P49]